MLKRTAFFLLPGVILLIVISFLPAFGNKLYEINMRKPIHDYGCVETGFERLFGEKQLADYHALFEFPENRDEFETLNLWNRLLVTGSSGNDNLSDRMDTSPLCSGTEIIFGTGNVEAVSGNGSMAAGFAPEGELTVLKWPTPSFHDQVSYLTPYLPMEDTGELRDRKYNGAAVNAGSFAGLYITTDNGGFISWFRDRDGDNPDPDHPEADDWEHSLHYAGNSSVVVVEEASNKPLGIDVTVKNFVVPNDPNPWERNRDRNSILVRKYDIRFLPYSPVKSASFIYFENFDPCSMKLPGVPLIDHLFDAMNDFGALYKPLHGAILHYNPGDPADGLFDGVYLGIGGDFRFPDGWQVGMQYQHDPSWLIPQDAYFDAQDGQLSRCSFPVGIPPRYSAALQKNLNPVPGEHIELSIFITAAYSEREAMRLLEEARDEGADNLLIRTETWWSDLMAEAKLPEPSFESSEINEKIRRVAERAILNVFVGLDKISGAVVASVNTQSPYGEDWPRDGAFIDHALDIAGFHEVVGQRLMGFYSEVARDYGDAIWFWPGMAFPVDLAGTYEMNYYSDGVTGGPIFFEIDNAGLTAWSMWDHYLNISENGKNPNETATDYLKEIYPHLSSTVQTLALCRDIETGLQCFAFEDDSWFPTQTLHGAITTYTALRSGIEASEEMKRLGLPGVNERWLERWRGRIEELDSAIREYFFNESKGAYIGGGAAAWLVWPAEFISPDDPEFDSHCRYLLDMIAPALNFDAECASYQAKITCALAEAGWFGDASEYIDFNAEDAELVLMTEVATPGTDQYGENYVCIDTDGDGIPDTFDNRTTIPHIWEGVLQYIAAMKLWPPAE